MKEYLKRFIKKYGCIYHAYYNVGSIALWILKYLVKTDKQLILFVSYSGKEYSDSPYVIFSEMLKDAEFKGMKYVWAFEEPDKYAIEGADKVRIDTWRYFILALKARCWITNVSIERGLNFKGRNTFYFNTWHGSPIKKIGWDVKGYTDVFLSDQKKSLVDAMLAQGDYDSSIFQRVFCLSPSTIKKIGFPRNDTLINFTKSKANLVKNNLKIPIDKKVILYAPTFRDFLSDNAGCHLASPPIDVKRWESVLANDYVVLFRAHSAVSKEREFCLDSFMFDMSHYSNLNDLLIISDILISDYSSIFFDYSLLNRPMICFAYDFNEYQAKRGLYIDLKKDFLESFFTTEEELLDCILTMNEEKLVNQTRAFREKYIQYEGIATQNALNVIKDNL